MSWWIHLKDESEEFVDEDGDKYYKDCQVSSHQEGGTICVGGTSDAQISVTYNYSKHFYFRKLNHLTGDDSILILQRAIQKLGAERDDDYWASTPGNAGYTCHILLQWAYQHPNGVWSVN